MATSPKPGFLDGAAEFYRGIGFVVTTPRLWFWTLVPSVIALAIMVPTAALGTMGMNDWVSRLIADDSSWATFGATLLRALLGVVVLIVAFLVGTSLAQPLSGWALERIVREQERALGSTTDWPEQPIFAQMALSLSVTLLGLAVAVVLIGILLVVQMVFPPLAIVCVPLKFLITGLLIVWDFADYPLSLRKIGVRARLRWMAQNAKAVVGFGLAAAILLMVPCVGLIVLPFGAAGAARLVYRSPPS